eukprot:TRINITY_DN7274_c0_g4_i1.p1 TRINITY_DN7274_c0_g4~~TRINITY_DN7274_c0_g4_i1.p1  ORF type:complete len:634 (-),score=115.03 TRINITY_DN7274_c0_g4_i1:38-1939(-)
MKCAHIVILCCVLAFAICEIEAGATRARASEASVRVNIYKKGQASGGYLHRVTPTQSWANFLSTAQHRLGLASICRAFDSQGKEILSMHDVLDDDALYFEPCSGSDGQTRLEDVEQPARARLPQNVPQRSAAARTNTAPPTLNAFESTEPRGKAQPVIQGWQKPWQQQQQQQQQQPQQPKQSAVFGGQTPKYSAPSPLLQATAVPPRTADPADTIKFSTADGSKSVGLSWNLDSNTPRGLLAVQLAAVISQSDVALVLPVQCVNVIYPLAEVARPRLQESCQHHGKITSVLQKYAGTGVRVPTNFPMINTVAQLFETGSEMLFKGSKNVGIMLFDEDLQLTDDAIARAQLYDRLIAPSAFVERMLYKLKDRLPQIVHWIPGVDTRVYYPLPHIGDHPQFAGRYLIYTAGPVDYSHGQDLVVRAFKDLKAAHPELRPKLLINWRASTAAAMELLARTGHVIGHPRLTPDGTDVDIGPWLILNGLLPDDFHILARMPPEEVAQYLRHADVALYTDRGCAFHPHAMTTLAAGIPTIMAANSGFLDLIHMMPPTDRPRHPGNYGIRHAYVIWKQLVITGEPGWGEAQPPAVVRELVKVYEDLQTGVAQDKAATAAEYMKSVSLETQTIRLLQLVNEL